MAPRWPENQRQDLLQPRIPAECVVVDRALDCGSDLDGVRLILKYPLERPQVYGELVGLLGVCGSLVHGELDCDVLRKKKKVRLHALFSTIKLYRVPHQF